MIEGQRFVLVGLFFFVGSNVMLRTQINNKVLRYDKNHQSVIHRKCSEARISLMQKVESERNIIKVHRSQINISVVLKAIKT